MKNYIKYIVAFAVVVVALGYFVATSMSGEKLYYKEIGELLANPDLANSKGLRISGDVTYSNFKMDKLNRYAFFEVTDDSGEVLIVEYNGIIPDAFEEGAAVVIEGRYDTENRLFSATKLMAKCPSKYEAEGAKHPDDVPRARNI